ncbi:hypothetical protein VTK56DRAFT_5294 [Thermocarpiscus australiensis]
MCAGRCQSNYLPTGSWKLILAVMRGHSLRDWSMRLNPAYTHYTGSTGWLSRKSIAELFLNSSAPLKLQSQSRNSPFTSNLNHWSWFQLAVVSRTFSRILFFPTLCKSAQEPLQLTYTKVVPLYISNGQPGQHTDQRYGIIRYVRDPQRSLRRRIGSAAGAEQQGGSPSQ